MTKSKASRQSRHRMTEAEGEALIEAWRRSGLGPAEFARTRGVGVHRIRYWRRRLETPEVTPFVGNCSTDRVLTRPPTSR